MMLHTTKFRSMVLERADSIMTESMKQMGAGKRKTRAGACSSSHSSSDEHSPTKLTHEEAVSPFMRAPPLTLVSHVKFNSQQDQTGDQTST